MADSTDTWTCPNCTLSNQAEKSICDACSNAKPGSEEPPCDFAPMEAAVIALSLTSPRMVVLSEVLPKRCTSSFTHLMNGDCMPHALALGTHYLLERQEALQSKEQHVSLAAQMRSLLHAHMDRQWFRRCMVTEDPAYQWSELVKLAHNDAGALDGEEAQHEDWGDDPNEQLERCARCTCTCQMHMPATCTCHMHMLHAHVTCTCTAHMARAPHAMHVCTAHHARAMHACRWRAERAQFYCGMPELLAFAEMSQEGGGPGVILRVWKQVDRALKLLQSVGGVHQTQVQAVVRQHVHVGRSVAPQLTAL